MYNVYIHTNNKALARASKAMTELCNRNHGDANHVRVWDLIELGQESEGYYVTNNGFGKTAGLTKDGALLLLVEYLTQE